MITWQSVLSTLGVGGLSVGATLLVAWLRSKTAKWSRRISNPIIERLNEQLDIWIDDSIDTVNKNFVDKLKETGEWDRIGGEWIEIDVQTGQPVYGNCYLRETRRIRTGGVFDRESYKANAADALERCLISLKSRLPKQFGRLIAKYYNDPDLFYKNRIDERIKKHEPARQTIAKQQRTAEGLPTAFGSYAP